MHFEGPALRQSKPHGLSWAQIGLAAIFGTDSATPGEWLIKLPMSAGAFKPIVFCYLKISSNVGIYLPVTIVSNRNTVLLTIWDGCTGCGVVLQKEEDKV